MLLDMPTPARMLVLGLLPLGLGLYGCESFDPLNVVRVVKVEIINLEKAPDPSIQSMAALEATNTWNPLTPEEMNSKWEAVDLPMTGELARAPDLGSPWQAMRCRELNKQPGDGADVKRQECILEATRFSTVVLKPTTKSSDTTAMWSFTWNSCPGTKADQPICTITMDGDAKLSLTITKKPWS